MIEPGLGTARLKLRTLDPGDEALYARVYSDPALMRHVATPLGVAEARRSFAIALRQAAVDEGIEWWVLVERGDDRAIGLLGSTQRDGCIELGAMLLGTFQGKGYAVEALSAVVDEIRQRHPSTVIQLRHSSRNSAMGRVASKLGFDPRPACDEVCWRLPADRRVGVFPPVSG